MKQNQKSFAKLILELNEFDSARNWIGLDPADLAKSIVLESAELLEHFQWDNTTLNRKELKLAKDKKAIASEAADILIYLLKFCRETKIDLISAAFSKLEKTDKKYPPNYKKDDGDREYLKIKRRYRKN